VRPAVSAAAPGVHAAVPPNAAPVDHVPSVGRLPSSTVRSCSGTVPEAQAVPALRQFALRRLRLPVGCGTLCIVVPDPADWVRRGQWAEATLRGREPPYWVQVWPAALAAARVLAKVGCLGGRRVLDLGCGLGVPGLAAAVAGATTTFADREESALAFAQWNGERLARDRISVRRLDWSREVLDGSFDVIVLADVSYHPVHHLALHRHLTACLADKGVVVHADPHRREASSFVRVLQSTMAHVTVDRPTTFDGKRTVVRVCVASHSEPDLAPWRSVLEASPSQVPPVRPA